MCQIVHRYIDVLPFPSKETQQQCARNAAYGTARERWTSQADRRGRARETKPREIGMFPIEPAWRCREIVRNERRENELMVRGRGGIGDQEGSMSNRGDFGWWRGEGSPARRVLYTLQLSLNHSETVGVSQVKRQTKTNKQTSKQTNKQIKSRVLAGMNRTLTVVTFAEPHLREPMGMENRHVVYAYFVDENVKIRTAEWIFRDKGKRGGMVWECWNRTKGMMRVSDSTPLQSSIL